MRYLTKEWYQLSADLHLGYSVSSVYRVFDEALFQKLYKRGERDYIELEQEIYNTDPRYMLEDEANTEQAVERLMNEEGLAREDIHVIEMSDEERAEIMQLIEAFDKRLPFDAEVYKDLFKQRLDINIKQLEKDLPKEVYNDIADIRLFALGYCSKEVYKQLKKISMINDKESKKILKQYHEIQSQQDIPEEIRDKFGFHDSIVTEVIQEQNNITLRLDNKGGFSDVESVTFIDATLIKQDDNLEGKHWIYNELYKNEEGYEVHVLLAGETMLDYIIQSKDIQF
ncbi:MAG: DUF4085 family protein [Erysipelothrix sp.]|nr:DUF4085 family protein [Erysipelothrix sp.]